MTDRNPAPSSDAPVRPEGRQAAAAAADGLYRLLERVAQYPPGHPVVEQVRDRAGEAVAAYLDAAGTLRLEAGRNQLRVGSRRVDTLAARLLGSALAELDVVQLEIHRDFRPEELVELAQRLARLRATGGATAARAEIGELEDGKASEHVGLGLLDYAALAIDEGALETEPEPDEDDSPERIWNALSDTILAGDDSPETLGPEQLAGLLGDEIVQEGAGPEVLSGQLQRMLENIEGLDPEARREAQARVGRFVSALPPALRDELLRIDPSLSRAQPLQPDSLVTALLLGAVQGGDRPPEDAVALLNQLLRSTSDDSTLPDLLERVSAGDAPPEELDRLGAAVSEIFRKREDIQANPEDYQALIDSLARAGVKAKADPDRWKDRFDDPRDADGNRAHAVEIAAVQFRDREPEKHAAEVLAYLGDSTDRLIDAGRIAALQSAVEAAAELAETRPAGDDVRGAATAWIAEAAAPSRLPAILEAAAREPDAVGAALELTRRAGRDAAEAIFDALPSAPRALAEGLLDLLAALPPDVILARVRGRADASWSELRPLFPVLTRMEGPAIQDFLVRLLEHSDENVRAHALESLNEQAMDGDHVADVLFALLQDPSARIVKEAVRKLGALEGDGAVDLLADFVRGRLIGAAKPPPLPHRLYAVRVLTLRGGPGWKRLERCLARVSWSLRGDDMETAQVIASVLKRRSDDPGAARALARWRWSPARVLGGLSGMGKRKGKR